MGIKGDIGGIFRKGSSLIRLIYINIAVFIFITLVSIIGFLFNHPEITGKAVDIFAVPAGLQKLLSRPWTIITYMFTHKDIWHILFNMLWLYWFGIIFLEYLDQKKLTAVYILGGICGAIVYILSFNIFPAFTELITESSAIGASASVMAVVIAIAAYIPDYSVNLFILGRIKIKYMALTILVLTSFMDFSVNSGGKLAHIGGALMGYLYTVSLRKGKDPGKGLNRFLDYIHTLFRPRKKMKVSYRKPASDYEYRKSKAHHQAEINKILDKISRGGYDCLTKEEKDLLFRESQPKN